MHNNGPIMCNNAPFSVCRERFFFKHLDVPIQNPAPLKKQKNTSKHLKNTSKLGGGVK